MKLHLTVPLPPPLNNAYFTDKESGRRVLSTAGRKYKKLIVQHVRQTRFAQTPRPKSTRYAMTYVLYFPDRRRTDLSNRPKLLEDAIAEACGFDDAAVDDIRITRGPLDKARPRCDVTIEVLHATSEL